MTGPGWAVIVVSGCIPVGSMSSFPAGGPAMSESVKTRERPYVQTRTLQSKLACSRLPRTDSKFIYHHAPMTYYSDRRCPLMRGPPWTRDKSLRRTARANQHGVCHICGNFHTDLTRHSSECDQTPPRGLYPFTASELAD